MEPTIFDKLEQYGWRVLLVLLFPVFIGIIVIAVEMYEPTPKHYDTTCFNSEGKLLYHNTGTYHPHITRWGKVTCITRGAE